MNLSMLLAAMLYSGDMNADHIDTRPVKKPVLSDHDQALKMNAAFDKRQRKNSKRV